MSREMMAGGGPAFPHGPLGDTMHAEDGRESHQFPAYPGMSLRQWYAGMAMQAIYLSEQLPMLMDFKGEGELEGMGWDNAADYAFRMADAMLAEGDKP